MTRLHIIVQAGLLTGVLIFSASMARAETYDLRYVDCKTIRTISAEDVGFVVAWLRLRHDPSQKAKIDPQQIRSDAKELRTYCEKEPSALPVRSMLRELFDFE